MAQTITSVRRRAARNHYRPSGLHRAGQAMGQGAQLAATCVAHTLRVGSLRRWAATCGAFLLLACAQMPDGSHPFAVAAFAALLLAAPGAPSAMLGVAAGVLLYYPAFPWAVWWQVPACAALWLLLPLLAKDEPRAKLYAISACVLMMLMPLPFIWDAPSAMRLRCVSGALTAGAMVPVCVLGLKALAEPRRGLRADEQVCLLIMLAAVIIGAGGMGWSSWDLGQALSVFVVLTVSYTLGAAKGMLCGTGLGLALGLSGQPMWLFLSLALGGALAGSLSGGHKALAGLLMLIASMCSTLVINGSTSVILSASSVATGTLGFLLTPKKALGWLKGYFEPEQGETGEAQAVYAAVARMLHQRADNLLEMSRALPKPVEEAMPQVTRLEQLALLLCEQCGHRERCWGDDFESTSHTFRQLMEQAGEGGMEPIAMARTAEDLGCNRAEQLPGVINAVHRLEKHFIAEQTRQSDAHALASMQLDGISQALDRMAATWRDEVALQPQIHRRIQRALDAQGIQAQVISVQRTQGKMEVLIVRPEPFDPDQLAQVLSRAAEVPLRLSLEEEIAEMEVLFEQVASLEVDVGVAKLVKQGEEVAGDSHMVQRLSGGRQLLAISDGMGSGPAARRESQATLLLLAQCLKAGFTRKQALGAVNSLLMACSGAEMFATMDLLLVDLHSGEAAFEKLGASTSYVVRGDQCRRIGAQTLPMGMLSGVQPRSFRMRLAEGDLVVMVSDGVADGFPGGEEGLVHALLKFAAMPTQAICDAVMQRSLAGQGNTPHDDMTVLAVRIQAGVEQQSHRVWGRSARKLG